MRRLLTVLVLLLVVSGAFSQSTEEKVWKRVETLHKAIFETKDSAEMEGLVSEHLTYGHSGGAVEDKKAMIHKASTSKTEYKNPVFERVSMKVVKKTAYVRHTFRAGSVDKGVETPLALSILQVWQKLKGKWVLVARQAVKLSK